MHEWFKSYLSHSEQFVIVNGNDSISLPLTYGVLQGSILRPLLFLLLEIVFTRAAPAFDNLFMGCVFNIFNIRPLKN